LTCIGRAHAGLTDEIQVYDAGIAAPGVFNLTWHNNYTLAGNRAPDFAGGIAANHTLSGATEWALGVTPWFEAGLYFPLYSLSGPGALTYNGFKLRTLFVVPNAAERRFFYGVNFEYSDNTAHWDSKAFTAEIRPIFGWHLGPVDVIVNPILDYGSSGLSGLDFAPATRLAMRLADQWTVAAEEYADFGPLRHFDSTRAQTHQLFAIIDHPLGKTEVEFGAGYGITAASDRWALKLILSRDLH
jgi:hypothetical protein